MFGNQMRKPSRKKSPHKGGQQLPLLVPESDWVAPTSLPDLRACKQIALDRETRDNGLANGKGPGWATKAGYVCGVSIAWRGEDVQSLYIPLQHEDTACIDPDTMRRWEIDHQKAGVKFIFHNAHYDIGWGAQD